MSDDQERRLREALRDGVPEPPGVPAYGVRVEGVARRRRTTRRAVAVGTAAIATAAVVAVGATVGSPTPKSERPVASVPISASVPCNDSATVKGLPSDVTAVRVCIGSPANRGPTPRVPADALLGAGAYEFVRTILRLPKVGSPPCPGSDGPEYRFIFGYPDGSSASVHVDASGCSLLTIEGEVQHRAGTDVVETYLRLLHEQRAEAGVPLEPTSVVPCPVHADHFSSTLGADMQARDVAISAVLCRYDRDTSELRTSVDVGQGTQADELAALTDGAREDPCTAIRVKPPRYDDRVQLVDAYGDVVVATAFFCTPYEVDGQRIWPDERLQGLVNRLFRARAAER